MDCITCGHDRVKRSAPYNGKTAVWAAHASDKILRDFYYKFSAGQRRIKMSGVKGGHAAAQIIIASATGVNEYSVSVTDFKCGTNVIAADRVTFYNEKYVRIERNYEVNGAPLGQYPDALLPMAKAVEYGENKVDALSNQGIYLSVDIPSYAESGRYAGTVKVMCDGEVYSLSAELNVRNLELKEAVTAKSLFLDTWNYGAGEGAESQELLNLYHDKLLEYRLSPNLLVRNSKHTDEEIAEYVDLAYRYALNPKCACVSVPFKYVDEDGDMNFDAEIFGKYLNAFARKSAETGFNLFDKAVCYITVIDEPEVGENREVKAKRVVKVMARFNETKKRAAENARAIGYGDMTEIIAGGIERLQNIVTTHWLPKYDNVVETFCPPINIYDHEWLRCHYERNREQWFYTCVFPLAPYPTYHIEDTLLSARAVGWMQAEYNVSGILYWATDIYFKYENGANRKVDDCYEEALRYPGANGDGFLFYPGAPYGIKGPVASMRLEAIRDGLEDYELLTRLKERYAEISAKSGVGFDAKYAIRVLTQKLYLGTRVNTDSRKFDCARDMLYALSELAEGREELCIIGASDRGDGRKEYKLYSAADVSVSSGNAEIKPEECGSGFVYTVRVFEGAVLRIGKNKRLKLK